MGDLESNYNVLPLGAREVSTFCLSRVLQINVNVNKIGCPLFEANEGFQIFFGGGDALMAEHGLNLAHGGSAFEGQAGGRAA